ncbi:MAG: HAD-IB family phosphatase [Candidatus Micrarchaeota archaeon]
MGNRISVVIPALNEEKTIRATVSESLAADAVLEVIVVDDKSGDRTAEFARSAGARVIASEVRGKGTSMKDGLRVARGDIVVYTDADIKNFTRKMIDAVSAPILDNRCDFVKSSYGRKSGRVTELLAKPLLAELFPPLVEFRQPLSGIIAGRKSFFKKVRFENGYGVDIGILIDMVNAGARIMEVDIGYVEHKMKPWRKLMGMSGDVARSILKRARLTNRAIQEGIIGEANVLGGIMTKSVSAALPIDRAAFLDMDGTLIRKRFVFEWADAGGFLEEVRAISASPAEGFAKTKAIAALLRGAEEADLGAFARKLELSPGARDLVRRLKSAGFYTIVVTDSYECAALPVAGRVGADMVIANSLRAENGVCTGEVDVSPMFFPAGSSCASHAVCKLNAAMRFCSEHEVGFERTFAVGDSENDACLLRFANRSFAYRPSSPRVSAAAKETVRKLSEIRI